MAEKARDDDRMALDVFLDWDDATDTRYELIDGRVVPMNPPMAPHVRLLSRLVVALKARMPRGCGSHMGGGAARAGDAWNYRIAGVSVSCTSSDRHWIEEPRLVCEVLSPPNARSDLTTKLDYYRTIPSIIARCPRSS